MAAVVGFFSSAQNEENSFSVIINDDKGRNHGCAIHIHLWEINVMAFTLECPLHIFSSSKQKLICESASALFFMALRSNTYQIFISKAEQRITATKILVIRIIQTSEQNQLYVHKN